MIDMQSKKISKWKELSEFIKQRSKAPFEHPEFIFYFIFFVIGFGAIGVWSTWYHEVKSDYFNHTKLIRNIASFSLAIVATGSIEIMFNDKKIIRYTLSILSLIFIVVSILLYFFISSYWGAIPMCLFSLYIWWIGNAENTNLTENYFKEQSIATSEMSNSLSDYNEK